MAQNKLTIAIAGSTNQTAKCATALLENDHYEILLCITPEPKPIGRKQIVTKNPLHKLAENHDIPVVLVQKKLDESIKKNVENALADRSIDILLVVDFGYIVPSWLLTLPKVAPINIHPSALPRWRGSSPGQFALLYGETKSAVSIIKMNDKLDQGPIIAQLPFEVKPTWTQTDYYAHSFNLISERLPELLMQFATGASQQYPQPLNSPTPRARTLSKKDSFVSWILLHAAMQGLNMDEIAAKLPEDTLTEHAATRLSFDPSRPGSPAKQLERACRAFSPWPGLWTIAPSPAGERRMKILSCHLESEAGSERLVLDEVQLAGQKPAQFNQIRNSIEL